MPINDEAIMVEMMCSWNECMRTIRVNVTDDEDNPYGGDEMKLLHNDKDDDGAEPIYSAILV